jgi:hypothetical protein
MLKFIAGLGCAILGLIIWVLGSVVAAAASLEKGNHSIFADPVAGTLVVIGFTVMFVGPILFWFVLPIVGWVRRRGRKVVTLERPGTA